MRTSRPDTLFEVEGLRQDGGTVSGEMRTGPWVLGEDGRPAVGALGVLADNVLGYAVMASLAPGSWSISTEIWLDVIGPVPADGSRVSGEAAAVQAGSYASGRLVDASGQVVAEARQRGRRIDMPPAGVTTGAGPAASGDLVTRLGLRPTPEGAELHATRDLINPVGNLHGGVSLAVAELLATRSRAEQGSTLPTTSLHIVYTRGVPLDAVVELEVCTRHAGRTLWVTDVTGRVGGKVSTTARITAQT